MRPNTVKPNEPVNITRKRFGDSQATPPQSEKAGERSGNVAFTLPICPQSGQFGKRVMVRGGKPLFFSDKRKVTYQRDVATLARAFRPASPFAGPIRCDLTFVLPRPKALSRSPDGLLPHWKRPDASNLRKNAEDALSGAGLWLDDAQICAGQTTKYYAERTGEPRIEVFVAAVEVAS